MRALYEDAGEKVLLSISQSLEGIKLKQHGFRHIIPGEQALPETLMSFSKYIKYLTNKTKHPKVILRTLKTYIQKILGYPVSCSIDTITIGLKIR